MKQIRRILLVAVVLVVGLTGCGSTTAKEVPLSRLQGEELGSAMPEILLVEDNELVFWGEFGLFRMDIRDGSVLGSADLSRIKSNGVAGSNHMAGEVITRFWVDQEKEKIYFLNTGQDVLPGAKGLMPNQLDPKTMELTMEVSGDLGLLPPEKVITEDAVGGQPDGYISNIVSNDEGTLYYLISRQWMVNDLSLVSVDAETLESVEMVLFPTDAR